MKELYVYAILASLLEAPEKTSIAKSIALSSSIRFATTFYKACEHLIYSRPVASEDAKSTQKYWLPGVVREIAECECWRWANGGATSVGI